MRRLLAVAMLALASAGCAGPADAPDQAANVEGIKAGSEALGPDETWYLDYTDSDTACLEQDALLVAEEPDQRACWHLPGVLLDQPRTFTGIVAGDWPKGSVLDGVLSVAPQTPSPSSFRLTVYANEAPLGTQDVDLGVVTPLAGRSATFSFTTAAAAAPQDAIRLVVEPLSPTMTDYIEVGHSHLRVRAA